MLHQIGNGALGPVFRAYDQDRDRLVAIKLFRLDLPPERVHQLAGEFEKLIAAELAHPVIATPRATGIDGNSAYLAQDFAAADSLDIVMREQGPAPAAQALRVAVQLADALDYAADRHVVHGALHPRDILLSQEDIRIVGLGIARALEHVGATAPVRRPYAPPERINDGGWDRTADVFSLAALVFEMLTGKRVAGTGSDAAEGLTEVSHGDLEAVQRVFALALASDPAYRYKTATAFTDALRSALDIETPAASPRAVVEDAPPKPRTRRARPKLRMVTPEPELPLNEVEEVCEVPEVPEVPRVQEVREASAEVEAEDVAVVPKPRRRKVPAPTPVAIETAHEEPLAEPAPEPEPVPELVIEPEPIVLQPIIQESVVEEPVVEESVVVEEPVVEEPIAEPVIQLAVTEVERIAVEPEPESEPPSPEREPEPLIETVPASLFAAPPQAEIIESESESIPESAGIPTLEPEAPSLEPRVPNPAVFVPAARHAAVWPIGVAAVLGIAIGFGAGYTVAIRDRASVRAVTSTAAAAAPVPQDAPAAAPQALGEIQLPSTAAQPVLPAPTTKASAPATPFAGRLLVRSTPSGAHVIVDGKDRGQTPATIRDLGRGEHRVQLERDGYRTAERRVALTQPAQSLSVRLTRGAANGAKAGGLVIESRPQGAAVIIDGRPAGRTPLTLTDVVAGTHAVRIERDGYRIWTAGVDIAAGEQHRVTASLEK